MKRKIIIAGYCLLLAVGGLGAKQGGVIKIGCVGPLTGDQASLGLDQAHALQIAVDRANAQGEILPGYRLEVVSLDDQHNPAQAVAMAKRLVADPDVLAVIGHVNSSCSLPAAPVYEQARMVQISPSSTNPQISRKGYATFFRTCATDDIQGPQAAYFAVNRLKARKIFIIDDKSTYGKEIAEQFEQAVIALGAAVLGHEGITQSEKDFSPLLTKIKGRQPDLIYFGGMYPEGALLVRQAQALGLAARWLGPDGLYVGTFIELAQEDAEGVYLTFVGADITKMASAKEYIETYTTRYGQMGPYSAYAYDAANIVIEAIRKAGKKNRHAVLEELRRLKDFPGVIGVTNFDEKGDTTIRLIGVFQVKNGAFEYVGPAKE